MDGTTEIHRDSGVVNLSKGGVGFIDAHCSQLQDQYVVHRSGNAFQLRVVFWCYDNT